MNYYGLRQPVCLLCDKHGPEAAPSYSQKYRNYLQNKNRTITENSYKIYCVNIIYIYIYTYIYIYIQDLQDAQS